MDFVHRKTNAHAADVVKVQRRESLQKLLMKTAQPINIADNIA